MGQDVSSVLIPHKGVKVKLSLCLARHDAMTEYGEMEVLPHTFLTSTHPGLFTLW
jgi:hypothetical protein